LARLDALIEETEDEDSDKVGVAIEAPSRIDAALLSDEEASEPVQPTRHREREGGA
jgi:hypothetical protein